MKKILGVTILVALTLTGCARLQIWFGMGESAGVDYSQCKVLEANAKNSSLAISERQQAMKELSACRKAAESKFLESH